jgi:hypothetical protein
MAVTDANRLRWRSILISRAFKGVFFGMPEWLRARALGWLWRAMFMGPDGELHRAGEVILADLRRICFMDRPTIFDADPAVMAYREGARRVFMVIMNYLELNESTVLKIMEVENDI